MASHSTRKPGRPGWVYVLTNPAYTGLVKVGHTDRHPETRAAELSAVTGVPARFIVAYAHQVTDHEALEGIAHGRLAACRTNDKREFFRCSVGHARRIIEQEAAALLLPWWRAWLHRLAHPLPAGRSSPPGRRPSRRRSRFPDAAIVLLSAAFALMVALRPGWLPAWVLHIIAGLPHPLSQPQGF